MINFKRIRTETLIARVISSLKGQVFMRRWIKMKKHLYSDGDLFLKVDTYWDHNHLQWVGVVEMKNPNKLITAKSQTSLQLIDEMEKVLHQYLEDPKYSTQLFNMFKSFDHWSSVEFRAQRGFLKSQSS